MNATKRLGRQGGLARARLLDAVERSSIARNAARARWLRSKRSLTFDPSKIGRFCEKWKVMEVAVFGSASRGDMNPRSDVDTIISGNLAELGISRFVEMRSELEEIFGRSVDLFTMDGVRCWRNEFLKKRVLLEARVIHASS